MQINSDDLFNWIMTNYKELAISFANWENAENIPFAAYCVALYVKHKGIM